MKTYYVYILTNKCRGTLYIGVTGELQRRIIEHKLGKFDGFTKKYCLKKLVYVQSYKYVNDALKREKVLKRWLREWKLSLIEEHNPGWDDLYAQFWGQFSENDYEQSSGEDPGSQAGMTKFASAITKRLQS